MKTWIYALIGCLLSLSAIAQEEPEVYKLTANDVEHFMKEYSSLKTDLEKFGVEYDAMSGEFTLPETVKAMSDFNHIVTTHGYKDWEDFVSKTSSLLMAYASIISEEGIAESKAEIEEKLKKIDKDTNLTYDQKEMMKNQLQAGLTMMESYTAIYTNSANVAVVNQYIDQLKILFEE